MDEVFAAGRPGRGGPTNGGIEGGVLDLARRSRERPSLVIAAVASGRSVGRPRSETASDAAMLASEGVGSGSGDVLDKKRKVGAARSGLEWTPMRNCERKGEVRVACRVQTSRLC